MARHYLKQLILFTLSLLMSAFVAARSFISRQLKARFATAHAEQGGLPEKPSWQRAAIVIFRNDAHTQPFLINLLDSLAENNFFVLAVSAGNISENIKQGLLPHCNYLLERFSFGQESLIKAGWDWIKQRDDLKAADTFALANDAFFFPRRFGSTVGQMLERECGWQSLYEFAGLGSVQSSFQIFRAPVLTSEAFHHYWNNFTLNAGHLQSMALGESNFAAALFKADFAPQAYYNASRLQADIRMALENENIPDRLHDVLNLTLGFERINSSSRMPLRKNDALSLPADSVIEKIELLTKKNGQAYAVGLLCNYFYQAPIKRDICDRSNLPAADLIDCAQGFSTEEKVAMANDLHGKLAANIPGVSQLPKRFMRKQITPSSGRPISAMRRN